MKTVVFLVSVALLFFSGCWVASGLKAADNRDRLNQLEVGMTKDQVKSIMGNPYKREAMGEDEWWLYLSESTGGYYKEYMPIGFNKGIVVGWGRNFYAERRAVFDITINKNR